MLYVTIYHCYLIAICNTIVTGFVVNVHDSLSNFILYYNTTSEYKHTDKYETLNDWHQGFRVEQTDRQTHRQTTNAHLILYKQIILQMPYDKEYSVILTHK